MKSLLRYVTSPDRCGYLPDQRWSLEYELVSALSRAEYLQRMLEGWRRFGRSLFRPKCPSCSACQALRVAAPLFRPNRSQRRTRKLNDGTIRLQIGRPSVTTEKLDMFDRYHAFQADFKGWPGQAPRDPESYANAYVHHPFAVDEFRYYLGDKLIGVGYVDHLPDAVATAGQEGLSAIYFFYDPEERHRSLGTWNVLCIIDEAVRRGLPWVYLGYYVPGCRSMAYKGRFPPSEIRCQDGVWRPFSPPTDLDTE